MTLSKRKTSCLYSLSPAIWVASITLLACSGIDFVPETNSSTKDAASAKDATAVVDAGHTGSADAAVADGGVQDSGGSATDAASGECGVDGVIVLDREKKPFCCDASNEGRVCLHDPGPHSDVYYNGSCYAMWGCMWSVYATEQFEVPK